MDGNEIIEKACSREGSHDARTIVEAAEALTCLVRHLNNATRSADLSAGEVYAVTSSLCSVTDLQSQLLRQLQVGSRPGGQLDTGDTWDDIDVDCLWLDAAVARGRYAIALGDLLHRISVDLEENEG
jgi:hypothetical protein